MIIVEWFGLDDPFVGFWIDRKDGERFEKLDEWFYWTTLN